MVGKVRVEREGRPEEYVCEWYQGVIRLEEEGTNL
jgi:hypothetical protein